MLPFESSVSVPPIVTPQRPRFVEYARAAGRHGQLAILEELDLRGPLPRVIAHGREKSELGRDGLQHDLEAHLVVARRRAAVRDGVRAELLRELRQILRLQAALGADAQRVHVAARHVAHDQELEHLVEELGPRLDEPVLARRRARVARSSSCRAAAASMPPQFTVTVTTGRLVASP